MNALERSQKKKTGGKGHVYAIKETESQSQKKAKNSLKRRGVGGEAIQNSPRKPDENGIGDELSQVTGRNQAKYGRTDKGETTATVRSFDNEGQLVTIMKKSFCEPTHSG